jgi:hypothetical protein
MVVAILTGHAPVRTHLHTVCLFEGDPTCRFCTKEAETEQHIICHCEALARQCFNVFGNLDVEPKDISTASVRNLYLFIRGTGLLNLCWMEYLGLHNKPKAAVHIGEIMLTICLSGNDYSNTPTSWPVPSLLNTPTSLRPVRLFKHTYIIPINLNITQIYLHGTMHYWLFKCTCTKMTPSQLHKRAHIATLTLKIIVSGILTPSQLHKRAHIVTLTLKMIVSGILTPAELHKHAHITTLTLKMIVSGIPSLTSWLSPLISTPFLWIATRTVSGNGALSTITDTRYTMPGLTMRLATTKYVLCNI